jgi:ribosomal protection tetracycline resistance protein
VRDRLSIAGAGRPVPVTEVGVSEPGGVAVRRAATAGQIVALRGPEARIGDALGRPPERRTHRFPPATVQAWSSPKTRPSAERCSRASPSWPRRTR